jgi:hypothetical protein
MLQNFRYPVAQSPNSMGSTFDSIVIVLLAQLVPLLAILFLLTTSL